MDPVKERLASKGLYNCISCNRPKTTGSFPDDDIQLPCLKCQAVERGSSKYTRSCLRCSKAFTTRNKFYRICFGCKDSPDFRDHFDAGAEMKGS